MGPREAGADWVAGGAWGAAHGVVVTAPLPIRLGLDWASDGNELCDKTAAAPQLVWRAAAERDDRAVDDFNFNTLPDEVEVETDCDDAPAIGG